jgi:Zn-dependent protease with chaperone function
MTRLLLMVGVAALAFYGIRRLLEMALRLPEDGSPGPRWRGEAPPPRYDPLAMGEWLHGAVMDAYGAERPGWALEQVERVMERLQRGRPADRRLVTEVLWVSDANAFTAPGRYVYISRRLLERCPTDAAAALVLAHEIAHHDLGHVELFAGWLRNLPRGMGSVALAGLFRSAAKRCYGPEREAAADRHALELCRSAGYDPALCLKLFDVLEADALDHGDVEGVFGPDAAYAAELGEMAEWRSELEVWLWERARGYPSLRERRAALEEVA